MTHQELMELILSACSPHELLEILGWDGDIEKMLDACDEAIQDNHSSIIDKLKENGVI